MIIVTTIKDIQAFFLGLIIVEGIVCFFNDMLVNEDEIVEREVDEGLENIN